MKLGVRTPIDAARQRYLLSRVVNERIRIISFTTENMRQYRTYRLSNGARIVTVRQCNGGQVAYYTPIRALSVELSRRVACDMLKIVRRHTYAWRHKYDG